MTEVELVLGPCMGSFVTTGGDALYQSLFWFRAPFRWTAFMRIWNCKQVKVKWQINCIVAGIGDRFLVNQPTVAELSDRSTRFIPCSCGAQSSKAVTIAYNSNNAIFGLIPFLKILVSAQHPCAQCVLKTHPKLSAELPAESAKSWIEL